MKPLDRALFIISEKSTIADALRVITENKRGAVIVTGDNNRLRGVVADGDIRRALVKGATTLAPIEKVLNMNVLTIAEGKGAEKESKKLFAEHPGINLLPIIDTENVVTNVAVRA